MTAVYRLYRTAGLQDYTEDIDYTGLQYIGYTELQYIGYTGLQYIGCTGLQDCRTTQRI